MASSPEILPARECVAAAAQSACVHQVQFYQNQDFLAVSVAEFVRLPLISGGAAILIASESHRGLILQELDNAGVPGHVMLNRCLAVDAEETVAAFMRDGCPDPSAFNETIGALLDRVSGARTSLAPVAAFGEMVAILWARGEREAAVQLEQLWTEFCRKRSLPLLCAYPMRDFCRQEDQEYFARICAEHSMVIPAEDFTALNGEDEKSRRIAQLQQRASALESEIMARATAEEGLKRSHIELERTVEERTQALRRLSLHLLNLRDAERRRIARELHDSLGQDFVGLRMNLDLARRSPHRAELWEQCDRVLDHCISEVRTLSYLLHPPMIEDVGFLSAAEWYIQDFNRRSGMRIVFEVAENVGSPPNSTQLVLFRILQEALINIHRHARATAGSVRVSKHNGNLLLEISDNGVGVPAERLHRFNGNGSGMGVGLTGTWERVRDLGGQVELIARNPGTAVRISIPFSKPAKPNGRPN
jgi:signal transduction histidine kinase